MNINSPIIYFVFPYRGVGGVPILFVRLAEYLVSQGKIQAFLVDYPDGAMAKTMNHQLCTLVPYLDDKIVLIPDGSYAVFQSMTPWSIFPSLVIHNNVHLLFWNCHPFNLIPTLPGFRQYMQTHRLGARLLLKTLLRGWRNTIHDFLAYLLHNKGIVFMDASNVRTTCDYLDVTITDPKYLPIPIESSHTASVPLIQAVQIRQQQNDSTLRVVWLGRIVDFKFYILKLTLQNINEFAPKLERPVVVTVVGDGAMCNELKALSQHWLHIQVDFVNHIDLSSLDNYLCTQADILVAMGTSVLEGAKLGIPSILLDFSYSEVNPWYHYQWLYTRQGFTLGDVIDSKHLATTETTLQDRLNELLTNPLEHGIKCQQYVQKYHSLEQVAIQFMDALAQSTAYWGDLQNQKILNKGMAYSVLCWLRQMRYTHVA